MRKIWAQARNRVLRSLLPAVYPRLKFKVSSRSEAHAEEDKLRKELIEARNHADSLVYSVEKNVKEFGDKVDAAEKTKIEEAITKTKKRWKAMILRPSRRLRMS